MIAGFQIDIERSIRGLASQSIQGIYLGMRETGTFMIALG
jgi:hypothetical protein